MKFDRDYVREHSCISLSSATDSQVQVVLDQVLEYFLDKHVPTSDEPLAIDYAQVLFDEIFYQSFGASLDLAPRDERIANYKRWISLRWGNAREIPKGEIYSNAFRRF